MGTIQKTLIAVLVVFLAVVTALTWGSLGSVLCVFLLLLVVAMLLFRWFQETHDPDDYPFGNQ